MPLRWQRAPACPSKVQGLPQAHMWSLLPKWLRRQLHVAQQPLLILQAEVAVCRTSTEKAAQAWWMWRRCASPFTVTDLSALSHPH